MKRLLVFTFLFLSPFTAFAATCTDTKAATSYWSFDSSNANDQVASNNGVSTSVTYSSGNGKINVGGGFDGSTSKISMGNVLDQTGASAFSIVAWEKTSQADAAPHALVDKAQGGSPFAGFQFGMNQILQTAGGNGQMSFAFYNGTEIAGQTTTTWNDGVYHLAVITYDGSKTLAGTALYMDGTSQTLANTINTLTGSLTNAANFTIGNRDTGSEFWNGAVDEVGFYPCQLTAAQVTSLYNGGTGINPFTAIASVFNPMFFWDF